MVLAPTDTIEQFAEIISAFMFDVFDLMPGEYLLTDEALLSDFVEFGQSDTSKIWNRIQVEYGFIREDVDSEALVDIFQEIRSRANLH